MKLFDNSNDRKYFFIVPNILDDLNLSAHAFRLYCHLKRVAGENGECWQSTNTISKKCNMGMATVSKAKKELLKNGLIEIIKTKSKRGKNSHTISIVDVWAANIKKCSENSITSTGEVINSAITSVGEVNNFRRRNKEEPLIKKNPLKDMAEESAIDSGKDQNNKEIILQYPPLYQDVIQKFSEYFSIDPPNNKERDFRTWITGADAFVKACGERDPINVITTIYNKWQSDGQPYTVTDLYSLVKLARVKEEKKKPMKTITAPEGWNGK